VGLAGPPRVLKRSLTSLCLLIETTTMQRAFLRLKAHYPVVATNPQGPPLGASSPCDPFPPPQCSSTSASEGRRPVASPWRCLPAPQTTAGQPRISPPPITFQSKTAKLFGIFLFLTPHILCRKHGLEGEIFVSRQQRFPLKPLSMLRPRISAYFWSCHKLHPNFLQRGRTSDAFPPIQSRIDVVPLQCANGPCHASIQISS